MEKYVLLWLSLMASECLSCYLEHIKIRGKSLKSLSQIYGKLRFDYDKSYHNFTQIDDQLEVLSRENQNLTKLFSLGKTAENRDIKAMMISKGNLEGNLVVFECGIHAREWISVSFCLWSINKLLNDTRLLDNYQFLIIPVLNPDGYAYSWETERFWRKNREYDEESKCYGVDINRNFATKEFCVFKAHNNSCEEGFCGRKPFSSAEAKALSEYLFPIKHQLLAYFAFHSYGQFWVYHWNSSSDPYLEKVSQIGVNAIKKMFGTEYKFGHFHEILYKVSGTSPDWVSQELGVKLGFTIELPDDGTQFGFHLPCYLIKPVCLETWNGIEAVLDYLQSNCNSESDKLILFLLISIYQIYLNFSK